MDKWNEDRIREVFELALLGVSEETMAKIIGIPMEKFSQWKNEKPGLWEALSRGKLSADAKVAYGLYKRATGYDEEEEHVSIYKGEPIVTKIIKHIPPDPWSASKWLAIRQRVLWSETHRMEITNTNVNINKFDYTGLSDEELILMKKIGLKQLVENAGNSQ